MVKLIWNAKIQNESVKPKNKDPSPFRVSEIINSPLTAHDYPENATKHSFVDKNDRELSIDNNWYNILACGENKSFMESLLKDFSQKINLIYIDPPFATGADYELKILIGEHQKILNDVAYDDKWKNGLDSYLTFMDERLNLMKKLLSNHGSIYIHLDWHVSHYIKILMDDIFGKENFRNEIIWAYPAASARTRRYFMRSFDVILFYSKSDEYVFNDDPNIYMEYSKRVKKALKRDEKGIFYYRGGSHDGKKLSRKVYVNQKGIFPRDVWNDIPYIRANTLEYQGFSTQKPERLLKRIILASSNENDIIADFFCGSGTTLAVAEKLNRKWIGCDNSKNNVHVAKKRLIDINNSNDVMNWKQRYKGDLSKFKILYQEDRKNAKSIPPEFLTKNLRNVNQQDLSKVPEIKTKIREKGNKVVIELCDFYYNNYDLISESFKKKILSFSDWVDCWAVGFNSDEDIFNTAWISYRMPKNRRLELNSYPFEYNNPDNYMMMIKIIDIFGNEFYKPIQITVE